MHVDTYHIVLLRMKKFIQEEREIGYKSLRVKDNKLTPTRRDQNKSLLNNYKVLVAIVMLQFIQIEFGQLIFYHLLGRYIRKYAYDWKLG